MAEGEERWELAVTVPPVTVETVKVVVRCGRALVVVECGDGPWVAEETGGIYGRGPEREDLDAAVADGRRIAEESERFRLLSHALDEALTVESTRDGEG